MERSRVERVIALMAKKVDATDLKSVGKPHPGSSPGERTIGKVK